MLDYTDIPYPNTIWGRKPDWEIGVKVGALLPIVICGLFGNLTLLVLILKNKQLRTPTNMLIANLACADFVTLLFSPWLFLLKDLLQNYELGPISCKLDTFIEISLLLTSVFNLVVVSYVRLIAIVQPHEAQLTKRKALVIIFIVWVLAALLASPLIVFKTYKVREWSDYTEKYCREDQDVLPTYWNVLISFMIWIPLGVMLICYTTIFIKLDKYKKKVLRREHPISVDYKKKVARMLFIIVLVFVMLRVPFTAVILRRNVLVKEDSAGTFDENFVILWFTCNYLMFSSAAFNPIIYGFMNENFRRAFANTTLGKCCFKTEEEKLIKDKLKIKDENNFRKVELEPRGPLADSATPKRKWINIRPMFSNLKSQTTKKTDFRTDDQFRTTALKDVEIIYNVQGNYI